MPDGTRRSPTGPESPVPRQALIEAMRGVFGGDARRVGHALAVLDYAERILAAGVQADRLVVTAAAVLHDIGIHEAERKHGSPAGRFQEIEGPPIARSILKGMGLPVDAVDHVCRIVGSHHTAGTVDTPEFRIVWDADWLVNLPDEYAHLDREGLTRLADRAFRTPPGRRLAEEVIERMVGEGG